jgi:hypothetical protein
VKPRPDGGACTPSPDGLSAPIEGSGASGGGDTVEPGVCTPSSTAAGAGIRLVELTLGVLSSEGGVPIGGKLDSPEPADELPTDTVPEVVADPELGVLATTGAELTELPLGGFGLKKPLPLVLEVLELLPTGVPTLAGTGATDELPVEVVEPEEAGVTPVLKDDGVKVEPGTVAEEDPLPAGGIEDVPVELFG